MYSTLTANVKKFTSKTEASLTSSYISQHLLYFERSGPEYEKAACPEQCVLNFLFFRYD